MRSVTALLLRAGLFFQLAIFFDRSSTISSSIRVTLLMIPLIYTFISPVEAGDQDMSFIESTLRFLTRLSAFLISRSSSIVIPENPVICLIEAHMEKFILAHCTPSSSLQTSNYPNWSELPTDMIGEIVNRLPNFSTISYKLRRLLRKMSTSRFGSLGGGCGGSCPCKLVADSAWEFSIWTETFLRLSLCRSLGGMILELYFLFGSADLDFPVELPEMISAQTSATGAFWEMKKAMHVFIDLGFHKLVTVPPSRPGDSILIVAKILGLTPFHQTTFLKSEPHKESSTLTGLGRGATL
uniref:Uncharacterized protein n=1 Tax=Fagus sylvatica TaxID=28930 RepID=A0A2N9F8H4_FAGSY